MEDFHERPFNWEFHNNSDDTVQFSNTYTYYKNEYPTFWCKHSKVLFPSFELKEHHVSEAGLASVVREIYAT